MAVGAQVTTGVALVLFCWSFLAPYVYVQHYCNNGCPVDGSSGSAVAPIAAVRPKSLAAAQCEPLIVAAVREQAKKCAAASGAKSDAGKPDTALTGGGGGGGTSSQQGGGVALNSPKVEPIDLKALEAKITKAKQELQALAAEIDAEPPVDPQAGNRRAAVVFQDYSTHLEQLKWVLYSWHAVGLDTAAAAFDIVIFADPKVIKLLPAECEGVPEDQSKLPMKGSIPGRCLYQPLVGISHTEPLFEGQHAFNSLHCLTDPKASKFLNSYRLLLRADMDTFFTPKLVDWWPEEMQMRDMQGYAYNQDVRNKLAEAAQESGLRHVRQTDLASSWYGPARMVTQMCRITIAAGRFLKLRLFGNNPCRWPKQHRPPGIQCWDQIEMSWGTGIYEGVLLLYAQELAANHIWASKGGTPAHDTILDHATMTDSHVCVTHQLHVHHGEDRFSKTAFSVGRYNTMDLSQLDLRRIDDFATYMALRGNNQGRGDGDAAVTALGVPLRDLCKTVGKYEGETFSVVTAARGWCIDRFSNKNVNAYGCQPGSLNQRYDWTTTNELRIDKYHCLQPMKNEDKLEVVVGHCSNEASEEHKKHQWDRVPKGNAEQVKHRYTGLCMQASTGEAKHITLEPCSDDKNQLWHFKTPI